MVVFFGTPDVRGVSQMGPPLLVYCPGTNTGLYLSGSHSQLGFFLGRSRSRFELQVCHGALEARLLI